MRERPVREGWGGECRITVHLISLSISFVAFGFNWKNKKGFLHCTFNYVVAGAPNVCRKYQYPPSTPCPNCLIMSTEISLPESSAWPLFSPP